ncbi:MAG: IS1380 family transposase [Planctomycetota bacterium]|jgi:hypothetical protein|nr:IS1380 family transposase [Arenicellales bacterium]MDP6930451.1 IS1380 family transposase [Planctomycetota bacterium]|tara:strand:+ start:26 stop:1450 length:1425 start_codon:yes stop_codon:yes gene_type:complete
MATQCSAELFEFHGLNERKVVARFDGGQISSDGGSLLLGEVEQRTAIIKRLSQAFTDYRDSERIEHSVAELVAQRVYGLALGYEDLNDHDRLREDHLLGLLVGKQDFQGLHRSRSLDVGKPLASSSTLNRLELSTGKEMESERYKKIVANESAMDKLLLDVFVESHGRRPARVWLDLDATDDPLHGEQEGRFFHGYYRCYCYLPLYIFSGEHLLCARLRESNQDGAAGSVTELQRIVGQIRRHWSNVPIAIRGDSGFCREAIMAWCESNNVDYVLGLAKNARLKRAIGDALEEARLLHEETGEACRIFKELEYKTRKSWSRTRRVVGKAEHLAKGSNPRFVVTTFSADEFDAQNLYEEQYCIRGDMENRIKEQQLDLFADRTSTATMRANQLRLYLSSFAYTLMTGLRRLGLKGTSMAKAQCGTIREKLFKIAVRLKVTVRKVWLSYSESYPYAELMRQIVAQLSQVAVWRPPP